jgi:hypothetical protein
MLLSVVQMIAVHYYTSQRFLQPLDALVEFSVLIQQFVTMICYLINDA